MALSAPASYVFAPMAFYSAAGYLSERDVGSLTRRSTRRRGGLVSVLAAFAPVGETASRATGYVSVIDGSNRTW